MATRVRAENSGWITTEGFSLSSGWTSGNLLVVHIAHRSGVTAPDPPTVFVGSASAPMTFRGAATLDLTNTEDRMGTYHYTRVIDGTEGTGQAIVVSCTDRQHVVVAEEWNGLGAFVEFVGITDGTNNLFNNDMPTTSVLGGDAELLQFGCIKSGNGTPVNPAFTFSNAGNEYQFGPFAVDAYDCMGAIGSQSVTSGAAYTDTFNMDAQGAGTGHASFAGATLVYNAGAGNLGFSEVIARAYDAGEIEVDGVHASGGTVWWAVRDSADAQLTKSEILNGTGNAIANGTEAIGVISEFASGTALAAGTYVVDVYTDDGSTESDVQSTAPLTLNPIANVTQAVYKLEGAGGPVLPYAPLVDQWLVLLVSHRLGPPANEPAAYTYSENANALTFRGAVENEPLDLTHRSHVYVYARQIDGTEGTNRQINQSVSANYGHAALVVAGDLDFAEVVGNTSGVAFGNTTLAAADTSALNPNSAALSIATFKQDSPTNAAAAAFDNATLLRNFVNGAPPNSLYIATGLRESAAGGVLSDSVTWSGADTANDALVLATLVLEGPATSFTATLAPGDKRPGDSFSIAITDPPTGAGYTLDLDGVDITSWIDTQSAGTINGTVGDLHLITGAGDARLYGGTYQITVDDNGTTAPAGSMKIDPPLNTDNFVLTDTLGIFAGDGLASVGDSYHGFKVSGPGDVVMDSTGAPIANGDLVYRYYLADSQSTTWQAPVDVAIDVTPPVFVSADLNTAGDQITLVLDEAADATDFSGFSLNSGETVTYTSGGGTTTLLLAVSPPASQAPGLVINYTPPAGGTGLADDVGNAVEFFSEPVTTSGLIVIEADDLSNGAVLDDGAISTQVGILADDLVAGTTLDDGAIGIGATPQSGGVWLRQGDIGTGVRLVTSEIVQATTLQITSIDPQTVQAGGAYDVNLANGAGTETFDVGGTATAPNSQTAQAATLPADDLRVEGGSRRFNQALTVTATQGGETDQDQVTITPPAGAQFGTVAGYTHQFDGPSVFDAPSGGPANDIQNGDEFDFRVLSGAASLNPDGEYIATVVPVTFELAIYSIANGEWSSVETGTISEGTAVALTADDLELGTVLDDGAIGTQVTILADDLSTGTTLDDGAIGVAGVILADDLELGTVLDDGAIGTQVTILGDDLSNGTTLDEGAIGVAGVILADDLSNGTTLDEGAIGTQVTILGEDLSTGTTLDDGAIGVAGVILADDLSTGTVLDDGAISTQVGILADDLELGTVLDNGAIAVAGTILADDLELGTVLDDGAIGTQVTILADDLSNGTVLDDGAISTQVGILADDLSTGTTLDDGAIGVAGVILADDLSNGAVLDDGAISTQVGILADDLVAGTTLDDGQIATLGQILAANIVTATALSDGEIMPTALLFADEIVTATALDNGAIGGAFPLIPPGSKADVTVHGHGYDVDIKRTLEHG